MIFGSDVHMVSSFVSFERVLALTTPWGAEPSQEMEEIDWHFARALRYNVLAIGEMQALKMLMTLQCLTKAGPQ